MPRREFIHSTDPTIECPSCGGSGQIPSPDGSGNNVACPLCGGDGRVMPNLANAYDSGDYEEIDRLLTQRGR